MTNTSELAVGAIIAVVFSISLVGFIQEYEDTVKVELAKESTDAVAERINSNAKILQSYGSGFIELDLKRDYKLNISDDKINVSILGVHGVAEKDVDVKQVTGEGEPGTSIENYVYPTEESDDPQPDDPYYWEKGDTYTRLCMVKIPGSDQINVLGGECANSLLAKINSDPDNE